MLMVVIEMRFFAAPQRIGETARGKLPERAVPMVTDGNERIGHAKFKFAMCRMPNCSPRSVAP